MEEGTTEEEGQKPIDYEITRRLFDKKNNQKIHAWRGLFPCHFLSHLTKHVLKPRSYSITLQPKKS
jgi:hypothetical protein